MNPRAASSKISNEHEGNVAVREVPLAAAMAAGPDQSAVRSIVAPFESVAFVYADLATFGEEERALRWRQLAATLRHAGAPEQVVAALGDRFTATAEAPATLAVFATAAGVVAHEQRIAETGLADRAGYAAPAATIPLLACDQGRPPYVLVVADRAGADLTAGPGGDGAARTWSVTGPDDEIERNAPGGWAGLAQTRYHHRAEDSWKHNAQRVADEAMAGVAEVGAQVLVLSGDIRAVQLVAEHLPSQAPLLISHITGSRAHDGSQAGRRQQVEQALREAAGVQTRLLLEHFRAHLEPGGVAVEGRTATVAALTAGRVATLLVTDERDEGHQAWFGAGATEIYTDYEAAKLSGRPVRAGELLDVAVRAALLAGARVRVIPAGTPDEPREGIGAICRYASG